MDRRSFLLGSLIVFAASRAVSAQQTGKVYRIGFLGIADASSWESQIAALRQGLRELGYEEGTVAGAEQFVEAGGFSLTA
jgi:putative tryptophan/tyrosine transport system substrate-binding protein